MGPLLGRGKFAAVYSATHVITGGTNSQRRSVAVKLAQFKGNDANNWTPLSTPRGTIAPPLKPEEVALAAALNAAQNKDTPVDAQGRPLPPLACTTEFHREIKTLQHFAQHPNIVRLVGFTLAPLAVMLELLPEGSLFANLHDSHWQARATFKDRMAVLRDACAGFVAMHAENYLHRDVKSHNVMLYVNEDGDLGAKIADLGTAVQLASAQGKVTDPTGTSGYAAPEIFAPEGYGLPSDVYSFGILMWETCLSNHSEAKSHDNPLAGLEPSLAVEKILAGVRPEFNDHDHPEAVRQLIRAAWHSDPSARPTMKALLADLEKLC